ncbi:polysaccharide deacetylase family protein [Sphingomonas morindae]|uniref:Polysaccharide deacetylase n=1 Tax=Sphingomonas morindae TaxID=1541170 RepID=A0ABY4XB21_9SPHN|nr:hypothetical protein [Sphingomonas morindae]USI74099.1 hypothetical protein LHA26_06460 [Sphingomonas morindae]
MTQIVITVDTELSAGRQARGLAARANYESSYLGRCAAGDFGVPWLMDRLEAHGLKGLFFVDPMPALVHGDGLVADMVGPILARGHEVQLHAHVEWLAFAATPPLAPRGRDLARFPPAEQARLIACARALLIAAGAPPPTAFRAGNFGANDDTLRALGQLGLLWDMSANPAYAGRGCGIAGAADRVRPWRAHGVTEIPVSAFVDRPGRVRPAQVCAITADEMARALDHALAAGDGVFSVVTHSFEMLSRDRARPNRMVMARFEALCRAAAARGTRFSGLAALDPIALAAGGADPARLRARPWRTAWRHAEQALATLRYERRLWPARG